MSLIINNILDPNDVGTVSPGNIGLFAGPGDTFYIKNSSGTYSPISTTSGFNTGLIFNTFSYVLSITDGNSTQTASLIDIASGYYNTSLTVSTASNVLTLVDGFSTLTASLAYYTGGFNTGISYNTASNVLSITDGNSTISATLSLTGANTSLTFNPFNNILSIVDGFSTKTASLAELSGNIGLSFSNDILTLQDGRGTLTASLNLPQLKEATIFVTAAEVALLNFNPKRLVNSQGPGTIIEIVSASVRVIASGASYSTNTNLIIQGAPGILYQCDCLATNQERIYKFQEYPLVSELFPQLSVDNAVSLSVENGNPVGGIGLKPKTELEVYVLYRVIEEVAP